MDLEEVVSRIFANWTGLQMAVGFPDSGCTTQELIEEFKGHIITHLTQPGNVDTYSIEDVIEDYMDYHFDTILEDDSSKEVASLLNKFRQFMVCNDVEKFQNLYASLPVNNATGNQQNASNRGAGHSSTMELADDETSTESETDDETNSSDSGWTQVKSKNRRKK